MPFNLIPLIFILVAIGVLVWIAVRKFPELTNLEVESLPEHQAKEKKKQIIEERFGRVFSNLWRRFGKFFKPIFVLWGSVQQAFRNRVWKSKISLLKKEEDAHRLKAQKKEAPAQVADRLAKLLAEGDAHFAEGRFKDAEVKYLDVIRMDAHNVAAFRSLGKVYMKTGALDEAIQTFEFLLQMTPQDDTIYVKLGKTAILKGDYKLAAQYYAKALKMNSQVSVRHYEMADIYKHLDNLNKAKLHFNRALALEPTNPRYLDGALELSIILKDKKAAQDLYNRLRLVNPDNHKLNELKQAMNNI